MNRNAELGPGGRGDLVRGLQDVMDRLLREFSGELAPGQVVGCVARCTRLASRSDASLASLPSVVEQLARTRLEASVGRSDSPPAPRDVVTADLRWQGRTASAS